MNKQVAVDLNETVTTILPGWNDSEYLPKVLSSLQNQTVPHHIIYVDDGSTDNSVEIAKSRGIEDIVVLERKKRVYGGFPILAENVNAGLENALRYNPDFLVVCAGDVILEKQYLKKVLKKFEEDSKLVIASGAISGEYTTESAPRGAGRTFKTSFFLKHVKRFPHAFLWESYPVFKAQSIGYHTRRFSDIYMTALRPTRRYKPIYGYAMKELGYSRLYAYGRCLMGFLHNPETGVQMFRAYRTRGLIPLDKELSSWIKQYQMLHLRTLLCKPFRLVKRLIR